MSFPRPTIFALSSGRPPAAIAVIRISGPDARIALERMIGRVPQPRVAAFARVRDPETSAVIDEGLALWFPGPKSETGEDIAELQIHGGRAVIAATLAALGKLANFRQAEAGEFTRRAFENGRLDLTAVEGLADLVAAETEAQRRQALRQMQGAFAQTAERWRTRLIEARALLEAGIDFADEGDMPKDLARQALDIVRPVLEEINSESRWQGERLRDGLQVAIAGPPNVGKSTLLNAIARRDVAIVSPYAGTTRDVIEVHLDLGGYPVTLRDSAGIRPTDDPVELEGIRRAQASAGAADVVLWVLDARDVSPEAIAELIAWSEPRQLRIWFVVNKVDLVDDARRETIESMFRDIARPSPLMISAQAGVGIEGLVAGLRNFAQSSFFAGEPGLVTRERHRQMMGLASVSLGGALALADTGSIDGREELLAEQVRMATRALERLTGRVDVEDVLDVIFRDFCIGK
jgi:tRNA modification GTPase